MGKKYYPIEQCEHEDYNGPEFDPAPELPDWVQQCGFCGNYDGRGIISRVITAYGDEIICRPCLAQSHALVELETNATGCPHFFLNSRGENAIRAEEMGF